MIGSQSVYPIGSGHPDAVGEERLLLCGVGQFRFEGLRRVRVLDGVSVVFRMFRTPTEGYLSRRDVREDRLGGKGRFSRFPS